jgi:alkylation response protein AidB-like acyl-CoA dehydrogenase
VAYFREHVYSLTVAYISEALSDPNHSNLYKQQSLILVPANTPGLEIERILSVMGFGDAPTGTVISPSSTLVYQPLI